MLKKILILPGRITMCVVASALMLTLQGCKKDFDNLKDSWAPEMAMPLLNGSMSFEDIITSQDSTFLRMNPDKSLYLYYTNALPSRTAESLVTIPGQSYKGGFGMNSALITVYHAAPGRYSPPIPVDSIPFKFSNGASINRLEFKSGTLNISMNSDYTDSVRFVVDIPSLKNAANVPYHAEFDLNYTNGATLPLTSTANISLAGYYLDLSSNKIGAQVSLSFKYLGGTTNTTDSIRYNFSFSNVKYSYIDGYIGRIAFNMPTDSINFNLLNNSYAGNVQLTDPRINVIITNSFGIPINLNFSKFEAEYADGTRDPIANINRNLPYPQQKSDAPETDSISLNKTTSNIVNVLSKKPRKFIYGVTATGNPDTVNKAANFVKDTSSFKVSLETKIPLELTINNLVIQDTFPGFTFTEEQLSRMEYLKFKFTAVNGFPIDVGVQIYFTDENYNKLDSLMTPYTEILASAIVPAGGGRALPSPPKTSYFTIDRPRVSKLTNVKHILAKGVLRTYNGGTVPSKFYADYKLDIKIGMIAKVKPLKN